MTVNARLLHNLSWRGAGAALVASLAILACAHPVAAASPDFGTPTATSKFGTGVEFTQPYSGPTFKSAQIAITFPGSLGPEITDLPGQTGTSLKFSLGSSQGDLLPNTKMAAHFDVTLSDGTVEVGPTIGVTYADDRFQWQTITAGEVTVHFYSGNNSFGQQLGAIAKQGLTKAASFMNVDETQPIDFFVYGDQQSFLQAMGQSTTGDVGGEAFPEMRTDFALITSGDVSYAQSVIPHELTHIVFADAIENPYHEPLHWLNEGLAVYLSDGYASDNRQRVAQAASNGTLMPLAALTGAFPRTTDRFYLAYAEAVSAVDFLVRKYGQAKVVKLLGAYRTGATDDEAFQDALGMDTATFDKAWLASNGVSSYQSFGPQPAPSGPIPPGWNSSGGATVPTPTGSGSASAASPAASASSQPADLTAKRNATLEAFGIAVVLSTIALVLLVAGVIIYRKSEGRAP